MKNSKLILHLKSLERTELNRFRDFVHSPYFNKHDKVIALIDLLSKYHPSFDQKSLTKEQVYSKIFKSKKYKEAELAHVMNYLQKLLEHFLATESFKGDTFLNEQFSLKKLKNILPEKMYESRLLKAEKHLEKNQLKDAEYFRNKTLIENELDEHFINRKKKVKTNHLQEKADSLDFYYIISKLQYGCDMYNRKNVLNIEYDFSFLDEILELIEQNPKKYFSIPILHIYYQILNTLRKPEAEEHYFALKNELLESGEIFPKQELKPMYDYAQNYCIKRINMGDSKYLKELLELYQLMLENKLIYQSGVFPESDYKNIVTIACRLKMFDWTEQFLYQYKSDLETSIQESVFQYNLASFYYEKKDFDKALKLLNTITFTDTYFALGARSMLMKIYFEMEEDEALDSHFDAFTIYLRRNKTVSAYQQRIHLNFIRFTRRIYQLKNKLPYLNSEKQKNYILKLERQIEASKNITNRSWLERELGKLNSD